MKINAEEVANRVVIFGAIEAPNGDAARVECLCTIFGFSADPSHWFSLWSSSRAGCGRPGRHDAAIQIFMNALPEFTFPERPPRL